MLQPRAATIVLISSLACTAGSDDETIQAAYDAGAVHLAGATNLIQLPAAECGLQELDQALGALVGVAPNLKRQLIQAAAATVSADGYLQIQEAELLRAISDSLDCPMPPLAIALDPATSEFWTDANGGGYDYKGENLVRSVEEHSQYLQKLVADYPIISIEDGMGEDDWDGWKKITDILGKSTTFI